MAQTTINLVLVKLADALVQEALILHGVHEKVKWVQDQLEWIQCFLKDAETKRHKDERVKKWVNDVQEVGYLIDDILEKFLAEVGGGRSDGLLNKLKKMNLKSKHKIAKKIDQVQQRLREITENTKTYGIIQGLNETSSGASVEQHTRPFVNPDIDEQEVVGFGVDMKTIVDQLIDTNITRRSVVSIIGAGGSGKTTLTRKVYKSAEVKRHFGFSMWLTISQEYKPRDILIKMLEEIQVVDMEKQKKDEQYFITELNRCLSERKYLIVLDDVWSSNVWTDQLQFALPDAHNGSRVLITSRFINVGEEMDRISKPYVIQPLNEEESKQLLLKKIFPNQFSNECPSDLIPLATQFTKICGGWPLPLVVLGGILSRKNPNYITWDEEMQKMDWQTDGSNFMGVISTSYENLPVALKPCFMYFGVFPEDYQIKATTLIQLWIAEGFIRQERTKLLEDVAESYLQELVQRCMVQVSSRSCTGKIKYCHIHDLLRDLAIQKAMDDNFLTVLSKNDANPSCRTCARRVALHDYGNKIREHAFTNLRSLINFGHVPNFIRFGTLRVLHIKNDHLGYFYYTPRTIMDNFWVLDSLTALKYFGPEDRCSRINAPFSFFNRYPLTYMKNIQTVRAMGCTSHGELPRSFWGNKQLRHINLSICYPCGAKITKGPRSAVDLPNLLTLKGVRARQDWVAELPHFPNIRKLGIVIPEDVAWEPLINLLSNLNYMGSLHLITEDFEQITFPDCISAFKNHNRLHSFILRSGTWRLKEVIDCTLFPPNLVKLKLWEINFEEDPMPQLEKLPKLRVLTLFGEINTGNRMMICCRGGFGCLQKFHLHALSLVEWKIEEGAMPVLNQLILQGVSYLQQVPNLQYLPNILECTVLHSPPLKSKMLGEDQWKIKHIPSVIFKLC